MGRERVRSRASKRALTVGVVFAVIASPLFGGGVTGKSAPATITGEFSDACRDFTARSTKDISNVVLLYADGRVVRDETINSRTWSINGAAGDELTSVEVKSGTTTTPFGCQPPATDTDGDGVDDDRDNCPSVANVDQADRDRDGVGDACDPDDDNDDVNDTDDNCPITPNPGQADQDGDGTGDACDSDRDGDDVADDIDNCPSTPNRDQADNDDDGTGDACDPDDDNDGVEDVDDNCPTTLNPDQADQDGDGKGDACDGDRDGDGVPNADDNCPATSNAEQADQDEDGIGDACDDDRDGDGVVNVDDNCPATTNDDQADLDGDNIGDACDPDDDNDATDDEQDNCPTTSNADQADQDGDGTGDACDDDRDGDGVLNTADNCPATANADQADQDHDGTGDACDDDSDSDDDGLDDGVDNCPSDPNPGQSDLDADGAGDACDADDDGDGLPDGEDNCPADANADQADRDDDGRGDVCDPNEPPIADAGPDQTVEFGSSVDLDGGGSSDADGDTLTYAWSLSRPDDSSATLSDATSATPTFTPDLPGTYVATLVVHDGLVASSPDSAEIRVGAPELSVTTDDDLIGIGATTRGVVSLSEAAPPGGIEVALSVDNGAVGSVSPAQVTILPGETVATFTLTGNAVGFVEITATSPIAGTDSVVVEVTNRRISLGTVPMIAPGQTVGMPLSITTPAPVGGLTVTLTSDDPAIAAVDPSVFVPEGRLLPDVNPRVTGVALGTTTIVAHAPGFLPDNRGVEVKLVLTFSRTSIDIPKQWTETVIAQLSGPAPAGGLDVALSLDAPLADVPPTVNIPAGTTRSPDIAITALNTLGVTTLRGTSTGTTSAASTIRVVDQPAVQVVTPNFSDVNQWRVGRDLQIPLRFLLQRTPQSPVDIEVVVSDPSFTRVTREASRTQPGQQSVVIPNVTSTFVSETVYLQGWATGDVTITASAPRYASDVDNVEVTPSGFALATDNFTTTTFSANTTLVVRGHGIDPTTLNAYNFGGQEVRGGLQVSVPVASSNTSVGTFSPSDVVFAGGTGSDKTASFDPIASGTTTLSVSQPSGFTAPTSQSFVRSSVTVTVDAPDVQIENASFSDVNSFRVGRDLQALLRVRLAETPPAPVDVTVTIADAGASVVNSTSRTSAGAQTLVIPNVASTSRIDIFLQGRVLGATRITASAPGYDADTDDVEVTPSGFALTSENFTTTTFSPNTQIAVRAHAIDPTTSTSYNFTGQEVRGGLQVNVPVASSDANVGTMTSSEVVFNGGTGNDKPAVFDPIASGTTNISVSQPPGFTAPTSQSLIRPSVVATVDAPDVEIRTVSPETNVNSFRVGRDLQAAARVAFTVTPPAPVDLTVTISDGDASVVGSTNRTSAGTQTLVIPNVTSSRDIFIQGLNIGSTQITASAPGYDADTDDVEVTPSGFALFGSSAFTTTTFSLNSSIIVRAYGIDPATHDAYNFTGQEVRGGLQVSVPVASSDTNVGTLTPTSVLFAGGTGADKTTSFDPGIAGTTDVTVGQPAGFTAPTNGGNGGNSLITVTVRPPDVRLITLSFNDVNDWRIGRNLQDELRVALEVAPPEPVDVTVSITAPSLAAVTTNRTAAGTASVTFPGVTSTSVGTIRLQGLERGGTTMVGQAAGYADDIDQVEIVPAGFAYASSSFSTSASGANRTVSLQSHALDPSSKTIISFTQEVRGGLTVNVPVTSSNPSVGVFVETEAVFTGGGGVQKSVTFDPISAGTTTLSLTQPAGFENPFTSQLQITATVT